MIRSFENNRLGLFLAATCGALALLATGLAIAPAFTPIAALDEDVVADIDSPPDPAAVQPAKPLADFAVIAERPVFNETRRPPSGPGVDGELAAEQPAEQAGIPDVELGGIVITPSLRMATLKTPESGDTLVAFEGELLGEGFGSWEVTRIEERMVTLGSGDGSEMELKLEVNDEVIKPPPEPKPTPRKRTSEVAKQARARAEAESPGSQTRSANAAIEEASPEAIRERIEERREELRKAAEERDAAQAQSYSSLLQERQREQEEERARQQEPNEAQEPNEGQVPNEEG